MIEEIGPVHFYCGGLHVGGAAFRFFWSIILSSQYRNLEQQRESHSFFREGAWCRCQQAAQWEIAPDKSTGAYDCSQYSNLSGFGRSIGPDQPPRSRGSIKSSGV